MHSSIDFVPCRCSCVWFIVLILLNETAHLYVTKSWHIYVCHLSKAFDSATILEGLISVFIRLGMLSSGNGGVFVVHPIHGFVIGAVSGSPSSRHHYIHQRDSWLFCSINQILVILFRIVWRKEVKWPVKQPISLDNRHGFLCISHLDWFHSQTFEPMLRKQRVELRFYLVSMASKTRYQRLWNYRKPDRCSRLSNTCCDCTDDEKFFLAMKPSEGCRFFWTCLDTNLALMWESQKQLVNMSVPWFLIPVYLALPETKLVDSTSPIWRKSAILQSISRNIPDFSMLAAVIRPSTTPDPICLEYPLPFSKRATNKQSSLTGLCPVGLLVFELWDLFEKDPVEIHLQCLYDEYFSHPDGTLSTKVPVVGIGLSETSSTMIEAVGLNRTGDLSQFDPINLGSTWGERLKCVYQTRACFGELYPRSGYIFWASVWYSLIITLYLI